MTTFWHDGIAREEDALPGIKTFVKDDDIAKCLSCQRRLASRTAILGICMKEYYVYIMASKRNGTLYTGVTSDLIKRVWQHKSAKTPGFTSKYKVNRLVYYEIHGDIMEAIKREKNIKAWKRSWKLCLIETHNPNWNDCYETLV